MTDLLSALGVEYEGLMISDLGRTEEVCARNPSGVRLVGASDLSRDGRARAKRHLTSTTTAESCMLADVRRIGDD